MRKSIFSPEQKVLQELLIQVRKTAGWRQIDVAERLGTSQQYVSRYESGEKVLDLAELRQVCEGLGVALMDFVQQFEEGLTKRPDEEK